MSDPFDFSDFGSARLPVAASPAASSAPGFGGHATFMADAPLHNGFDPFGGAQPGKPWSGKAFAETTPPSPEGVHVARPPLALFALALALAAAGILISALWGQAPPAAAVGWFLAGPVAIGVLSAYTRIDTRRRTDAVYSAPGWASALYWVVVMVCLAGIGLGAWYLALWAGGQ